MGTSEQVLLRDLRALSGRMMATQAVERVTLQAEKNLESHSVETSQVAGCGGVVFYREMKGQNPSRAP